MREFERRHMVQEQLAARGIADAAVLDAMLRVPRHRFVPEALRYAAYFDEALRLGRGQSISQPYMVARMLEALQLQRGDRVLEVGTGSGYQAALLAELAGEVFSIECDAALLATARATLRELGYERVQLRCGDGTRGWPEAAPFQAIVVAAAGAFVPAALHQQLAVGGRLVMPVGSRQEQQVVCIRRTEAGEVEQTLCGARFVPLVGGEGALLSGGDGGRRESLPWDA